MPIDAVPDITNVQVQINTEAEGYSPLEAEQRVTFPVETAIAGTPGLDYTRSVSRYGLSQVTVVFKDGTHRSQEMGGITFEARKPFYSTPEWQVLRERVVLHDGARCRHCGHSERLEVHHWLPEHDYSQDHEGRGYGLGANPLLVHETGSSSHNAPM